MSTYWQQSAEKRLNALESKFEKLLDPEIGIYPIIAKMTRDTQNRVGTLERRILLAVGGAMMGLIGNLIALIIMSR